MSRFFSFVFALLALSFTTGCIDDPISPEDQLEKDINKIEEYLLEKGLTAQSTASGLHYIIEVEGMGANPSANSVVTVNYKGYYLDDEVFDESGNMPATFSLQNVIDGWKEGIPLFKKSGKGKLFVPSSLGYGSSPYYGIPGNSVLIFDIELIDF